MLLAKLTIDERVEDGVRGRVETDEQMRGEEHRAQRQRRPRRLFI